MISLQAIVTSLSRTSRLVPEIISSSRISRNNPRFVEFGNMCVCVCVCVCVLSIVSGCYQRAFSLFLSDERT